MQTPKNVSKHNQIKCQMEQKVFKHHQIRCTLHKNRLISRKYKIQYKMQIIICQKVQAD